MVQALRSKSISHLLEKPVIYRWSGRFAAQDAKWCHMERQLVDYELIVMEKGTLFIEDEWGQYEISEGEYILMAPTKLQKGTKPSKCRFYWMHFWLPEGMDGLEECFPKQGQLQHPERLYVLFKQLMDFDLRYMDPLGSGYFATTILCELQNQLQESDEETDKTAAKESLSARVDEYLVRHMAETISVGVLAREFGYHEKYFSALFKKETGRSVKQYVDERKLDRAKYLLLNTDAWVAEIAEHLGFGEVQNFYHQFKKAMNCTPSEYRELYRKKQDTHL